MNALARLTQMAHAGQWSGDGIDWSQEPVVPAGVPSSVYVDMVSQLYYAEEATLAVLPRMERELPGAEGFLATQRGDEYRHSDVYRAYLARLGDIAPVHAGMKALFDRALAFQGPSFGLVAALNLVMEHEALAQQQRRIDTLPCPLFRDINRAIVRDEARHAAFGVIYLREVLPAIGSAEKRMVFAWVRELWQHWVGANQGRYVNDGEAMLRLDRNDLDRRWSEVQLALARVGLVA